jgi:xanthine dehydrogenase YagS FAD-binding subunit
MAMIRDVIPAFELFQPGTIDDTVALLDRYRNDSWLLAGGLDSMDWLKDRIFRPRVVIDLSAIEALRGIRDRDGGIEIGAMTTLTEITKHQGVRDKFGVLAEAAGLVASPQIRNQGTIGGNVSQDARCWYYRQGWPCYRAGGNICYADTPTAVNREHAIFEADRCVAVSPSDTAPALIALDATMVVRRGSAERLIPAAEYFVGPAYDITRMTVLERSDLLTAVRIPSTWAGKQFYFEKVRDRAVWDFGLLSVASAISGTGSIEDSRIVINGAAARPMRLTEVETAIKGRARNEDTANIAADIAVRGALPLQHNAYKIPMMRNLVKRAIRGAGEWTS